MNIELINTGTELMLGRVLNTHQRWICRRLSDLGLVVNRQVAIPDTGPGIQEAVAESLRRARLVIVTGGLGPTSDDITRDLIAALLNRPLREDPTIRAAIQAFFASRKREAPERVMIQARVPDGARVLPNRHGTAPGLAMEVPPGDVSPSGSWLILLPGPPRELHPMFDELVVPLLHDQFPQVAAFHCRTLRTCGMGESWVEERLDPVLPDLLQRGLEIGYCARSGEVDVRLVGRGPGGAEVVSDAELAVRERLGSVIYGSGEDTLESVVLNLLQRSSATLATAESCTGGFLAHRITNVPGASVAFVGGWVTYDNAAKQRDLGVSADVLRLHGAVSEACVRAMAEGARDRSGATHALALSGIAGPGGGTPDKPVGTVFIGLASADHPTLARHYYNPLDRETFKYVAAQRALEMLRRRLLGTAGDIGT